jgi:DNA-binding response OmpR family regulator
VRSDRKRLRGRRVLIVEDNGIVALDLECTLREQGADVVGPARSVADARRLDSLDAAVLDVNLGDEDVFPLADALAEAGIPFLFLTGHSGHTVPPRYRERPFLQKPYNPAKLVAMLASMLSESRKQA